MTILLMKIATNLSEDVSITFNDKTDPSDPLKREKF